MSACTRYPDEDQVLRYVTGELAEPELTTFEDHVFACDACLARVERYQAAQQVLCGRPLPALPTAVPSVAASDGPRPGQLPWWLQGAMAASLVLAAGGLWSWQRTTPPQAPPVAVRTEPASIPTPSNGSSSALQVAVLAMVTPPPYLSMTTRGEASAPARFADAMQAYARGDWTTAARSLVYVDTPEARFYQGIADLMRGDPASATRSLDVARQSGVQPYARESVFFLAKAALQRGDVPRARQALTAAREARASTSKEATRLLAALDETSHP